MLIILGVRNVVILLCVYVLYIMSNIIYEFIVILQKEKFNAQEPNL